MNEYAQADYVIDGDGFEHSLTNRELRIERACWLRADGMAWDGIAKEMGCAHATARAYVLAGAPELIHTPAVRGGGKPEGKYGKLSENKLRLLHRLHLTSDCPVRELGRRVARSVGYASGASAAQAIYVGWLRLGLTERSLVASMRRCSATKRQGRDQGRRCARYALVDSEFCAMHHPARREAVATHASRMREAA